MPGKSKAQRSPALKWLKNAMLPAAEIHTARRLTALAAISAATSGFKLVAPLDLPAQIFRYFCLAMGAAAALWLIVLIIFPPSSR